MMQTRRLFLPVVQALLKEQAAFEQTARRGVASLALTNNARKHGSGGRSSVSGATITVFGGTGFIGKYVVNELARQGSQVVCPFRCSEEKALPLKQMGDLGQVVILRDFSIHDDEFVKHAISRSDVVVNLIGANLPTRNFSLETVHMDWPAKLARYAAETGVCQRFIHFSDVAAAEDHPSRKLRTKALGDKAVRDAFPDATIVKPCTIVGDEDDFFNTLLAQVKMGPVVPLWDGGVVRYQPTYVPDVAVAVATMLQKAETAGKEFYLGGPEVLSQRQIVDLIYRTLLEDEDETMAIPASVGRLLLKPLQALQTKLPISLTNPMHTVDYIDEISRDKLVPAGSLGYADLDMVPQKVTEGLAIEPIRHSRVGGYQLGDASGIAKNLPTHIRKYYGMEVEQGK